MLENRKGDRHRDIDPKVSEITLNDQSNIYSTWTGTSDDFTNSSTNVKLIFEGNIFNGWL